MKMKFFDATYPARDARESISQEELVAHAAHDILHEPAQWIYYAAEQIGEEPPTPNKSARIYSRERTGMGQWITVEGSAAWFEAVADWLAKAHTIGLPA